MPNLKLPATSSFLPGEVAPIPTLPLSKIVNVCWFEFVHKYKFPTAPVPLESVVIVALPLEPVTFI